MNNRTDEDAAFLEAFENLTIPREQFGHVEHLRAAWTMLNRDGLVTTLERYPRTIRAFARRHHVPHLYHETITWFYLFHLHERMLEQAQAECWREFLARNADITEAHRDRLRRYYSEQRLDSDLARAHFLLPDRTAVR